MGPVKLIRGIGRILRGGADHRQVVLGCLLGVVIGMIPGFNGALVLAIALFFFLNANGLLAALGVMLGKVLCLVLAPVTFNIGYVIIHKVGLEGFFRWAADTPVLALLDLEVYSLVGGLPVALVGGLALGVFANRVLRPLQVALAVTPSNRVLAALLSLAFGKQRDLGVKRRLFRVYRLLLGACVIGLLALVATLLSNLFADDAVEAGMTKAVGAEVNVAGAHVSVLGGSFDVQGLEVTNPGKPTHNWVQVERFAADVDMSALLVESLVIDRIESTGVRVDTVRREPGRVLKPTTDAEEGPVDLSEGSALRYLENLEQWRKYLDYVERAVDYIQGPPPELSKDYLEGLAGHRGYLTLSAEDVLPVRPGLLIRSLLIDGIQLEGGQGVYRAEGQYLSDSPARNPEPMTFTLSDSAGVLLSVTIQGSPTGETRTRIHAPRVPLGGLVRLSEHAPVVLKGGHADVAIEGTLRPTFRCLLTVDLRNVRLETREGRGVFGLDPESTRRILDAVSDFTLVVELSGSIGQPRIRIDDKATLASLRAALVAAGQAELIRRANQLLEEVAPEGVEIHLPPGVLDEVKELLPGFGRKNDE